MWDVNEPIKDVSDINKQQTLSADKIVFEIEIENLHFKSFHLAIRLILALFFSVKALCVSEMRKYHVIFSSVSCSQNITGLMLL